MSNAQSLPYHNDESRFRDALGLAELETGFTARLVEKDYYCSIVLRDFEGLFLSEELVFKGGTSLSKVHSNFFRMSEDLDFGVSISPNAPRSARRKAVEGFKAHFTLIRSRLPFLEIVDGLEGYNDSRQYNARLAYRSAVTGEREFLKVEVAAREEVLIAAVHLQARTLLVDAITKAQTVPPFSVRVLVLKETYAEKARAALTRREPAIRDFFDLDNAVQSGRLKHLDTEYLQLVKRKLTVTADPVNVSSAKYELLRTQLETQLKPVLRTSDYEAFELDRAITIIEEVITRSANVSLGE